MAYLRATVVNPSLASFAAWLFALPELEPLVLRGKRVPRMLSFGLVRTFGMQPGGTVSPATMAPMARDLLRTLQGLARAIFPHFSCLFNCH